MVKDGNWIDRREAAERAGVHYNTIRNWHEGLQLFGPGEVRRESRGNDGFKWYYDVAALDRIVAARGPAYRLPSDLRAQLAALRASLAEVRAQLAKSEAERRRLLESILG